MKDHAYSVVNTCKHFIIEVASGVRIPDGDCLWEVESLEPSARVIEQGYKLLCGCISDGPIDILIRSTVGGKIVEHILVPYSKTWQGGIPLSMHECRSVQSDYQPATC